MSNNLSSELISSITAHQKNLFSLCDTLEDLANHLPSAADKQMCLTLSRTILPVISNAYDFEENTLFPHLLKLNKQNKSLMKSLERLKFEHYEDEAFAQEVSETLHEFVTDNKADLAEKLSYMLRGFFEGMRRHLAFEKEHLLPLLQNHKK